MTELTGAGQPAKRPLARHRLALIATMILAAAITWLTLTPSPPTPDLQHPMSDKIYHVFGFAALVIPTALLFKRSLIWIVPLSVTFGAAIEIIQPYTGRSAEAMDFVANLIGVGIGITAGLATRAIVLKRTRRRA